MKELMKYITSRKIYLSDLCEYYGEPEGVADHLNALAKKHPLFSKMFQKDIRRFTEEADHQKEWEHQCHLKYEQKINEEHEDGGCMDCPWGNGAGGCSIPGYCQENM